MLKVLPLTNYFACTCIEVKEEENIIVSVHVVVNFKCFRNMRVSTVEHFSTVTNLFDIGFQCILIRFHIWVMCYV